MGGSLLKILNGERLYLLKLQQIRERGFKSGIEV
jgi:hypothetical protein